MMTTPSTIAPSELAAKEADADFIKQTLQFALQRLMEIAVEALCKAAYGERSDERAGDWPYPWIDATYVKTRQAGRMVSVAVIIEVAVNTDGVREILGVATGASEAEPFWTEFLLALCSTDREPQPPMNRDSYTTSRDTIPVAAMSRVPNDSQGGL